MPFKFGPQHALINRVGRPPPVREVHTCRCFGCVDCDKGVDGRCRRIEETRVCDACWRRMLPQPKYPPDTEYE